MSGRGIKYRPLADYLAGQTVERVTLSFQQIEALLARQRARADYHLPISAYAHPWWLAGAWARHTQAWRSVGWQVAAVDIPRRTVTFARREDAP